MRSRICLLLCWIGLLGCGGKSDPMGMDTSCGVAGVVPASECTGIQQCGGASNAKTVSFCEHCFALPDTHVCEAGTCRKLPEFSTWGSIVGNVSLTNLGSNAQSLAVAAILPTAADGSKLTCQKLLSSCNYVNNNGLNANARTSAISNGGDFIAVPISIDAGPDRLYFIVLTNSTQGKGTILAKGCQEGITVESGKMTNVTIDLVAP
ncbi:MAG: hypothetical protein U1E65_25230 [Myxococcota bacterium]